MDCRLVAIDVDGTLLDSANRLTAATIKVLSRVQQLGKVITLATGKILPSVLDIVTTLGLNGPQILANGAIVQIPFGDVLKKTPVSQSTKDAVLEICVRAHVDLALYSMREIFVREHNIHTSLVVDYGEPIPKELHGWSISDLSQLDVYKMIVLCRSPGGVLDRIEVELEVTLGDTATVRRSVPSMVEITDSEATKGKAIGFLASQLGISLSEVIAIGDGENDIDMFQVVGLPVAMANASKKVREFAQITIGTNDQGGVAKFLSQLFLNSNSLES